MKKGNQRRSGNELETLVGMLSDFVSGSLTVSVNNFPFVKIDAETKTLDVEVKGFKESGLRIGNLMQAAGGDSKNNIFGTMKKSGSVAHRLHDEGWKVSVFEGKDSLVKIGNGVSSLTGYVWVNPLKLSKLRGLI